MSRGGRGRGIGIGRGGSLRVGGVDIRWEHDPELVINREPEALFPPINVPKPRAATLLEKAQVEHFRAIRKRIHDGPYYTVSDESGEARRAEKADPATYDPFEGMPSYSEKYKPSLRRVPDLSGRKYELHLFPRELWNVLDPKRALDIDTKQRAKRRKTVSSTAVKQGPRADSDAAAAKGVDLVEEATIEGDEEVDGEEVKIEGQDEEDDERSEPDPEEDFSEDEDDMADDYNAEKYFETGEGDDDDGGDGDDGGYD